MRVFQIIKLVLDDEYGSIPGNTAAKDAAVVSELGILQTAYSRLASPTAASPSYGVAACRFAYIYKYTTCHANIVAEKVAGVPAIGALFTGTGWVDVACVGGGPGSDFLGIIKHMIRTGSTRSLKTYLLDKEPGWGDSWSDVERKAPGLGFHVSTHAQVLDVLDPSTWSIQTKYRQADLFTFVFFISEIWRFWAQAEAYFVDLFSSAKAGSLFLFIDNNDTRFHGSFDTAAAKAGLVRLAGREEQFQVEYAEEKRDLEPYFSQFNHNPKIGSNIAWRVFQKP